MPPNAKRPDAAHIMELAENLAIATGTTAYLAAHAALEAAVCEALNAEGRRRAMDLVRRANERMRNLHTELGTMRGQLCEAQGMLLMARDELARTEARLAMAEDPTPPGMLHGTAAANTTRMQVAA